MTTLTPVWVRTSGPVIRCPARYRWTTAPAIWLSEANPTIAGYIWVVWQTFMNKVRCLTKINVMGISATDRHPEPEDNPLIFSKDSNGRVLHRTKPLVNQLHKTYVYASGKPVIYLIVYTGTPSLATWDKPYDHEAHLLITVWGPIKALSRCFNIVYVYMIYDTQDYISRLLPCVYHIVLFKLFMYKCFLYIYIWPHSWHSSVVCIMY